MLSRRSRETAVGAAYLPAQAPSRSNRADKENIVLNSIKLETAHQGRNKSSPLDRALRLPRA